MTWDMGCPPNIFKLQIIQYFTKKKVILNDDEKYFLVFDFWAYNNYYHWMVDSLCRLFEWKSLLNEYIILLPQNAPRYMLDTLIFFDVKNIKIIDHSTYLSIKNLYIPNYVSWSGQQNPLVLKNVRQLILKNISNEINIDYVYISRSNAKNRRISNEIALIEIMESNGFNYKAL